MQLEDLILVSIDDHVIEPREMFDGHVPAKYRDEAPKIVMDDQGIEKWWFQGVASASTGLNAVVGWPKEEWGMDPTTYAEMRPGAYDVDERVRDMNRNGILASMCFPSFVGFSGGYFLRSEDKDLALVMTQAYNDWHIDEFAPSHPGRFIPLAIPPVWDPVVLATEVRRIAKKGCHAITMPELPHLLGLPSYHDTAYWDPFLRAVSDEHVVVCLHIGQGFAAINSAPDVPIDNLMILSTQISTLAAQDLLWGAAFTDYPDLKIAWSEAGIGWIPFYLDRCDRHFKNQTWLGHDFGGKLPSEVFREHSLACYVSDPSALKIRHDVGIDIIAWECDYPHSDSIFPDAPEFVLAELAGASVPDDEIDQITWRNSCRFFTWDPFAVIAKEQANASALRSLSQDVDTSLRSKLEWRRRYDAAVA